MNSFFNIAMNIGQNIEVLKNGETISSILSINNIDALKELALGLDITFETTPPIADGNMLLSLEDKLFAYVFNNISLSDEDRIKISAIFFPIGLKVVSTKNRVIETNEVLDFGTSQDLVIHNYDTLTMETGASMKIANTPLILLAQTLVIKTGNVPLKNYDLGILGITGNTPPKKPKAANGCEGEKGSDGGNGLPSLFTRVVIGPGGINSITNQFVIYSHSGDGGDGGNGGDGTNLLSGANGGD